MIDVTLLTCKAYHAPSEITPYIQNILDEYHLLKSALEAKGLTVARTYWDDPSFDWTQTRCIVFRTIWDYFERFEEFMQWLEQVKGQTQLINPFELITWNIDKHYLADLQGKGVPIIPTHFVDKGKEESLQEICNKKNWKDVVIKPAVSGAAFHTYKIMAAEVSQNESLFKQLTKERDMLVQPYISTITHKGEASLMLFNGKYTHAIRKKAKSGDFRVQDDFGGTVHPYTPTTNEIELAYKAFAACAFMPAYGRADMVWDEDGNPLISELEIIEPELWIRNNPASAHTLAEGIIRYMK